MRATLLADNTKCPRTANDGRGRGTRLQGVEMQASRYNLRRIVLPLILLSAALATPGTANADLFLSKQDAKRATRQTVRDRYGPDVIGAVYTICTPWKDTYDPAYDYKRWSCAWAADSEYRADVCAGQVRIIGHRNAGGFYYRITHGIECF